MLCKDIRSLGLLSATLACLSGVPVAALASPSPNEELWLSSAESASFIALSKPIQPIAFRAEQKPQFTMAADMSVSDTSLSDVSAQKKSIDTVSPATDSSKSQTLAPTETTVLTKQSAAQETRILDRDRLISTEAASLSVVTPTVTLAQTTAPNMMTAQASDPQLSPRSNRGPYVSLSGGYQKRERAGEDPVTFIDFKGGYIFNGAAGYRFGDFRTDLEVSFFDDPAEAVSAAPTGRRPGDGHVSGRAVTLNLYYDIPIRNSPLKPYLGAGIGVYSTKIHDLTNDILASLPAAFGGPLVVREEKSNEVFAFQVRAGLGYEVSQNVTLFLGYRYFNGKTLTFSDTIFGTLTPNGAKLNAVEFGARILF